MEKKYVAIWISLTKDEVIRVELDPKEEGIIVEDGKVYIAKVKEMKKAPKGYKWTYTERDKIKWD
jgi:hypothetical protein